MQQQQQSPAVSSARFKPPRASLERIDHHRVSSDHMTTGSNMQLHSDSEDDVTGSGREDVTPSRPDRAGTAVLSKPSKSKALVSAGGPQNLLDQNS